jgi:hypothetical protein
MPPDASNTSRTCRSGGGVLEVENTNTCSYSVEHKLLPSFTKILQDLY